MNNCSFIFYSFPGWNDSAVWAEIAMVELELA